MVSLTGKPLKEAGHCTIGAQTIPVLPEKGSQAKLQNGSQMLRRGHGKEEEATGERSRPPGLSFQPRNSPTVWPRPAPSTSAFLSFPTHNTERRGTAAGMPPPCLVLAQLHKGSQATPAAHVHTHQPVGDSWVLRINPEFQWLVWSTREYQLHLKATLAPSSERGGGLCFKSFDFLVFQRA